MDFFEAQDRARRFTWKLIFLYVWTVLLMGVFIYLVVIFLFGLTGSMGQTEFPLAGFWHPGLFLAVFMVLLIIISTGSLVRVAQLRRGGVAVAEMLGGRKVEPSTSDPAERRLLHVVEEMAIASGLPVPETYLLEQEKSINAFAAGYALKDAVVGVTRGALDQLNRDELQGVIAHEFSHVFHGDTRQNIRLVGLLNGILLLHMTGLILLRSSVYSRIGRAGGGRNSGQAALVLILLGLALMTIGYIGMISGRIIQSAISRQREYLADASAVQYTRNPAGIAGALRKIAAVQKGGDIRDGHAMEMNHLFFTSGYTTIFDRLYATHPPLQKRIAAIEGLPLKVDSSAVGSHLELDSRQSETSFKADSRQGETPFRTGSQQGETSFKPDSRQAGVSSHDSSHDPAVPVSRSDSPDSGDLLFREKSGELDFPGLLAASLLAAIGVPDSRGISEASKLLNDMPALLRDAAHEPLGAEALVVALLLAGREPASSSIPDWLEKQADRNLARLSGVYLAELTRGKREWYLPLAEMSFPALRQMSDFQYQSFRDIMEKIIREDESRSLFGWALEKLLVRQLDPAFQHASSPSVRHHSLSSLGKEYLELLAAMAFASEGDTEKAWQAALKSLNEDHMESVSLPSSGLISFERMDHALDELAASCFRVRKKVVAALIASVSADGKVTVRERELLRVMTHLMGCPIPSGWTIHEPSL